MIILHPDIEVLRNRIHTMRSELRAILEEGYQVQNEVRRELLRRYDELFREQEVELQQKTLEAAQIQRRVELFTIRAQRGQRITENDAQLINEMVNGEFRKYRERLKEAFQMDVAERNTKAQLKHQKQKNSEGSEVARLYKQIVKQLHPDAQGGESEDFQRFWNTVQDAWQRRDLQRIRAIHNMLCIEERIMKDIDLGEEDIERLRVEARRLEMRVDYERRKLLRTKQQDPYSLADKLDNAQWVEQHRKSLSKQRQVQERLIQLAEEQLQAILGSRWDEFRTTQDEVKKAIDFQDDFMENSYFSRRG